MTEACCLLYVTAADREEAEAIARALLEARLIACANILGSISALYWWEGVIRQGGECAMLLKTTQAKAQAASEKIKSLHSYECPCILTLPAQGGNPEFLRWIAQEAEGSA